MPCAQPAESRRGVVDQHDGHARRQVVGHGMDHETGRPSADGIAEKAVAIEALAVDREEGVSDAETSAVDGDPAHGDAEIAAEDRKSTRLNSSHGSISY